MNAIELKNVSFAYDGEENVIENLNMSLPYGSMTLLSGPSGEGKSTVMNIIAGIIPNVTDGYLSGEVRIDNENVKDKKLGDVSRKVGIVLQNPDSQIIQKTVEDEIAFGLENIGMKEDRIRKQVETVTRLMKLSPEWESRKLSLGQKQRLIIASILAMGQKIILLDEPLSSIDKAGGISILKTLQALKNAGYCILIVEHRLDILLPFVDKIYHIENKRIEKIQDKNEYLKSQSRIIEDVVDDSEQTEEVFNLDHISFQVKKRSILKDVSFSVRKGKKMLILGENGCGKTTLIQIIARLVKQSGGVVHQNIDPKFKENKKGSRKWFRSIGYIFQNPDYQLFMPSVKQELYFNHTDSEYIDEIATLFDVKKLYDRHPQSLSEGQKRRVSIASIMAGKPEVVILDEPTVGQDYGHLKEMVNALNEIHRKSHNTMIIITHDVRCAKALCDDAVWIKDGIVKETGGQGIVDKFFGL